MQIPLYIHVMIARNFNSNNIFNGGNAFQQTDRQTDRETEIERMHLSRKWICGRNVVILIEFMRQSIRETTNLVASQNLMNS